MEIKNAKDAHDYAAAWQGQSRARTYLRLAAEGLEMADAIMRSGKTRYGKAEIDDNREAIDVLRGYLD